MWIESSSEMFLGRSTSACFITLLCHWRKKSLYHYFSSRPYMYMNYGFVLCFKCYYRQVVFQNQFT